MISPDCCTFYPRHFNPESGKGEWFTLPPWFWILLVVQTMHVPQPRHFNSKSRGGQGECSYSFIQKLLMLCNTSLFLLPSVQCFCVAYMWVRLPSPFINRITLPPHIIFMLTTYFPVVKNCLNVKYIVLIQIICFSFDLLFPPLFKFSKCCRPFQPMLKLVCVVLRAITQPGNKVLCFPPFFGWFAITQDPIHIVLWVTFNIHRSRTADGEL